MKASAGEGKRKRDGVSECYPPTPHPHPPRPVRCFARFCKGAFVRSQPEVFKVPNGLMLHTSVFFHWPITPFFWLVHRPELPALQNTWLAKWCSVTEIMSCDWLLCCFDESNCIQQLFFPLFFQRKMGTGWMMFLTQIPTLTADWGDWKRLKIQAAINTCYITSGGSYYSSSDTIYV